MRTRRLSAVAVTLAAAIGIAACGSSSSSSSSSGNPAPSGAASSSSSASGGGGIGHAQRRGLDPGGADLPAVGLDVEVPGPDRQLQPGRLGRRHRLPADRDGQLRRLGPGAQADRQEGHEGPGRPVPGRVRSDHRLLQPSRRQVRAQARRAYAGRHLPRQDQDLERSGDRQAQSGHEAAGHEHHGRAPLRLVGDDRRASPRSSRTTARPGSPRSAPTRTVKWPVGTGAAKNAGVAAAVKQTQGAIGYVEQAYALENGFTYASVKNAAGNYETPTIANTSAAAVGIKIPPDLGISTINSTGKDAYPIVSQTFLDAYKDPCTSGKASSAIAGGLKKFLTYAIGDGQQTLGSGQQQAALRAAARRARGQGQGGAGNDDL